MESTHLTQRGVQVVISSALVTATEQAQLPQFRISISPVACAARGKGERVAMPVGIEIDKCADDFCAVQSAGNWMVASISATKLRSDAPALACQCIVERSASSA